MWRCVCIATIFILVGCYPPEVINHNRQAPIIVDSTMQYDTNDIHAARVAWYADESVPPRFKRLLDAREGGNGEA